MAATVPEGNYANVKLRFFNQGQICENDLLYFNYGTTASQKSANAVATVIKSDLWDAELKPRLDSTLFLESIFVRTGGILLSPDPYVDEYTLIVNEFGSNAGQQAMPAWVSIVMERKPDNTLLFSEDANAPTFDKAYYGTGFAGLVEADTADGLIASAAQSAWDSIFEAFESITADSVTWVLMISRKANTIVGGNAPAWCVVRETAAHQKLGSRLSRKY